MSGTKDTKDRGKKNAEEELAAKIKRREEITAQRATLITRQYMSLLSPEFTELRLNGYKVAEEISTEEIPDYDTATYFLTIREADWLDSWTKAFCVQYTITNSISGRRVLIRFFPIIEMQKGEGINVMVEDEINYRYKSLFKAFHNDDFRTHIPQIMEIIYKRTAKYDGVENAQKEKQKKPKIPWWKFW